MPLFRRKQQNNMGLMALAEETAKMAKNMMMLNKLESALEREVEKEEKRDPPRTTVEKIRRKGENLVHGRYLLLMVVLLNVVDCLLVLGEIVLDIEYLAGLLKIEQYRSEMFIYSMKCLYPSRLGGLGSEASDIDKLITEILKAQLTWDHLPTGNDIPLVPIHNDTRSKRYFADLDNINRANSTDCGNGTDFESENVQVLEDVTHGLHKASITILGILVFENIFKIFCLGTAIAEYKLECFDSVIVIASFVLDIVFVKGLQQFTFRKIVLCLAFIVPWRIIRVVNSLVVAIMYHQHFRLVLLYKQKKKVSQELIDAKKGDESTRTRDRKVKSKTNLIGAFSSFASIGEIMMKPCPVMPNGYSTNPSIDTAVSETIQAKSVNGMFANDDTTDEDFDDELGSYENAATHF